MECVLSHAELAGAKVVLVGDPEQLQAIEAGAAFRAVTERHGWAEITEIRRQRSDERRVGKEGVSTCSSRWSVDHKTTNRRTEQHQTYHQNQRTTKRNNK